MSGKDATMRRDRSTQRARATVTQRAKVLAREEFDRKALSYAATAMAAAVCGMVIAIPAIASSATPIYDSPRSEGVFTDLFFLAVLTLLSINSLSRSYMFLGRDPSRGWLLFQRSLPISTQELVLARSLVMLPATVALTALFFTPITLTAWAFGEFDAGRQLWFWLVWLGYALFSGGVNLFLELGVKGRIVSLCQFVWMGAIVAAAWLFDGNITWTTFELAGAYGPLAAGISLLAGGLLFALMAKATERRVETREMFS